MRSRRVECWQTWLRGGKEVDWGEIGDIWVVFLDKSILSVIHDETYIALQNVEI